MRIINKRKRETPLACIQRLFDANAGPYTYAGRLDPMASGLLLVLQGEECKEARQFFGLTKEYRYSFVIGVSTDTYDVLGCVSSVCSLEKQELSEDTVRSQIDALQGEVMLPYPPYSSKTVNGTPLFIYARNGTIDTITLPERAVEIYEHEVESISPVSFIELREQAIADIQLMDGDFRQPQCIESWKRVPDGEGLRVDARVSVSGGTYVRAIVHHLGAQLGLPTVTTAIERTRIGDWTETL